MNDADSLLGKADQLMRRQRSFVASARNGSGDGAQEEDGDVPLLTEVVSASHATQDESALRLRLEPLLAEQRAALLREFECWLDEQLPQLVTRAMDGITDKLVAAITRRARAELLPRLAAMAVQAGAEVREAPGEDDGQPL